MKKFVYICKIILQTKLYDEILYANIVGIIITFISSICQAFYAKIYYLQLQQIIFLNFIPVGDHNFYSLSIADPLFLQTDIAIRYHALQCIMDIRLI